MSFKQTINSLKLNFYSSKDNLFIKSKEVLQLKSIKVYSIKSQLLKEYKNVKISDEFSIKLPKGIFFVKILDDLNKPIIKKVLIK